MPMVIPYDPSLVLGNIVPIDSIETLLKISAENIPIDLAQEKMNNLIAMKRSIDMTTKELINMKIDPSELNKETEDLKKQISDAARDYIKVKVSQEKIIQDLKQNSPLVNSNIESPIDYNSSNFKSFPLSSDSLKMDCQYFSFEQNSQSAANVISTISGYVNSTTSFLGTGTSSTLSGSAVNQLSIQREAHDISGTLVVSVTCTHKDANVLAPFILDVDKSIRIWNNLYKDDRLKVQDPTSIIEAALEEGTDKEKFLPIISGATYGSCFIGMVHILNRSSTSSFQNMSSIASQLKQKASSGIWFAKKSGKFGLDRSFSADIKSMLSQQEITSHVNLITMGIIPSIKSNEIKMAVKQFADFNPQKMMENLNSIKNTTESSRKTFSSEVEDAENQAQISANESAKVETIMLSLSEMQEKQNKVLDINSMMTALDNYIENANDLKATGVPINYYIKPISKAQLAQMWVAKYYPNEYMSISGDDRKAEGTTE